EREAVDRLLSQADAQTLDEPGGFAREATAVLAGLPEMQTIRPMRHQGVGTQLAAAHRLRQCECFQALPEDLLQAPHTPQRSREPHQAARRRRMPVSEQAL